MVSLPVQSIHLPLQEFSARSLLPARSDRLWHIQAGFIRTVTWLEDGTAIVLGVWGMGDIVGNLFSTVDPLQLECLTHVKVVPLFKDDLVNPLDIALTHLQHAEQLMVIRSYKRIDTMLLKLLSWLAQRFGQTVEHGRLIDLRLTHQDLAESIGSTRVTVTRTLIQLEQQGLIQRLSLQRIILQEDEVWHYEI